MIEGISCSENLSFKTGAVSSRKTAQTLGEKGYAVGHIEIEGII